jgi:hypothetical protein
VEKEIKEDFLIRIGGYKFWGKGIMVLRGRENHEIWKALQL